MNQQKSDEYYSISGVPARRRHRVGYQKYVGAGKWETFDDQEYASRTAIPLSDDDYKGLIEAHDLALPTGDFNEVEWRIECAAEDEDVLRAARKYDLSRGEMERARMIASSICLGAQREVGRKGRLRPRTALAALDAAAAQMERWAQSLENTLLDRHLPPHEAEDTRFRIRIIRWGLRPGARLIGRSPHRAAVVLLARGVDGVRRFIKQPFPKAVKRFKRRCVFIPQDSVEATDLHFRDDERWRRAVETWEALGRSEEECLLGLLTALGVDCERLTSDLRMRGAS